MRSKRLEWTRMHRNWTLDQWRNVIWSDESKFNLHCADNLPYVRRFPGERFKDSCVIRTVKYPQSQMIWGCFSYYVRSPLVFVDGIMNGEKYGEVVTSFVVPVVEDQYEHSSEAIFQDDSAPCHRAKSVSFDKKLTIIISPCLCLKIMN